MKETQMKKLADMPIGMIAKSSKELREAMDYLNKASRTIDSIYEVRDEISGMSESVWYILKDMKAVIESRNS